MCSSGGSKFTVHTLQSVMALKLVHPACKQLPRKNHSVSVATHNGAEYATWQAAIAALHADVTSSEASCHVAEQASWQRVNHWV